MRAFYPVITGKVGICSICCCNNCLPHSRLPYLSHGLFLTEEHAAVFAPITNWLIKRQRHGWIREGGGGKGLFFTVFKPVTSIYIVRRYIASFYYAKSIMNELL